MPGHAVFQVLGGLAVALAPPEDDPDAGRESAEAESPVRSWELGAFADIAYLYNSNRPANHRYRGVSTTPRTGEFSPQLVVAHVQHAATEAAPYWVQVAFQVGPVANAFAAAEPVAGGDPADLAGPDVWRHLALANAGWRAPTGTEIGAGLFFGPLGPESPWSRDNNHTTLSWMGNATPFYQAGVRLAQDLPHGVRLEGWIHNGWQFLGDNNDVPSYQVGVIWTPTPRFVSGSNLYFGPETADISLRAFRVHLDQYVMWTLPRLQVGGVFDGGWERATDLPGEPHVSWYTAAAFVRGTPWRGRRSQLDLAGRPEVMWDPDGRIFGVPQTLISATVTAALPAFGVLIPRLEYRYDHSTADRGFFYREDAITPDATGLARRQHIVALNLIGQFRWSPGQRRQNQ